MDAEFQCTNCEGSGYFDTPDGGEVACSVCHGKAAYSPEEIARAEAAELELSQERFMRQAAEAEVERLREQVAALSAELAELSAEYMALVERTADW